MTIQAQIFELIEKLKSEYNTAVMLITHDMGVVSELADDVAVMYMGSIVERGSARDVLKYPAHPYTAALLRSIPVLHKGKNPSGVLRLTHMTVRWAASLRRAAITAAISASRCRRRRSSTVAMQSAAGMRHRCMLAQKR